MALIVCNECGREVSENANACPNCGNPISDDTTKNLNDGVASENENTLFDSKTDSLKSPDHNRKKRMLLMGAAAIVLLVAIVIIATLAIRSNNKRNSIKALQEIQTTSISGGAAAEAVCNTIKKVWYNTIYEEVDTVTDIYTRQVNGSFHDDFNTALGIYFVSETYTSDTDLVEANKDSIKKSLKIIDKYTVGLTKHYDAAQDLYDAYRDLATLALSPTGSLQTYSASFSEADSNLLKAYEDFSDLMEDFDE